MADDDFIQLPPNSTGTKLRTFGPLGASDVYAEAVAVVDRDGDTFPESPQSVHLSSTGLAAGASVDLDATLLTSGTVGRLVAVTVGSSVPLKAELIAQPSGAVLDVVFTSEPEPTYGWITPHPNFHRLVQVPGARFRVRITNLDPADAADVHATVKWDEVTPA